MVPFMQLGLTSLVELEKLVNIRCKEWWCDLFYKLLQSVFYGQKTHLFHLF